MGTCSNCGRPLILNNGRCIYCNCEPSQNAKSKTIDQRGKFGNHTKSIEDLKIKVTSPMFDDIGLVLEQLNIRCFPFDNDYNCDILFLNCGTSDHIDAGKLQSFVSNGGVLYASDLTFGIVIGTWPDLMKVDTGNYSCIVRANIVDKDLHQYLGSVIDVNFDLSNWAKIVSVSQGKVLMESANEGFPIMVEFAIGKGKIYYTSFHNHAQASETENALLKLLVAKQVSAATKMSFQQTVQSMRLSL